MSKIILNRVDILKIGLMAEHAWLEYLHQEGVDTSAYPTHHRVCFPSSLQESFHRWFRDEYVPAVLSQFQFQSLLGSSSISPQEGVQE